MYLRGSKFNMTRRRRSSNPLIILALVALIGGMVYVNMVVIPATPPLFIPTKTPTRSPETFIKDAQDLVTQGKFQQAISAYKQAIQSDAKNPSNYIALARLQVFTGSYQEAIDNAQNALMLGPNNSMAYAIRCWAQGFRGDYLEAETSFQKAVDLDGKNGIAYAYYAETIALQYEAGKDTLGLVQKATDASRTAQTLAPNTLETHRARGIVLGMTQNNEEASREFEAAIEINPNIADLHLNLGVSYRVLLLYAKAIDEFNRANALNPGDPLANTYIARTYLTLGDFPKAIQYATAAIKINPLDPNMYGNLGTMYYRNKQYKEALEPFRLAVRGGTTAAGVIVPGLPLDYGRVVEYYYFYGLAAARLNQCSEALQISQLIQQGVPNDETAVFNAKEMINICQQNIHGTSTPTPTFIPGKGKPAATPKP